MTLDRGKAACHVTITALLQCMMCASCAMVWGCNACQGECCLGCPFSCRLDLTLIAHDLPVSGLGGDSCNHNSAHSNFCREGIRGYIPMHGRHKSSLHGSAHPSIQECSGISRVGVAIEWCSVLLAVQPPLSVHLSPASLSRNTPLNCMDHWQRHLLCSPPYSLAMAA